MHETIASARKCPKCGALAGPESVGRPCAACLLESALSDEQTDGGSVPVLMDFGDYELLEELGRGGQGVVYRARQKGLKRIVALKIIGLGHWATEAHLRRFRLEAEAAAQLDHPLIVPIYEIGERDGACYFSMKFVEGGQLDAVVRQEPLAIRASAALMVKVARTVHYAHEHGVLHRDIKPGNILLDKNGEPHLTDFGLARLVEKESNVTRTMDVLGTPSYMAPEQAAGQNDRLTSTTDVYGLGAVFYHLLTGQPPFAGGTTFETIRLVLEAEPRSPRLWNPKVDRDLATICLKCLQKEPARRYSSALALAEDLERWLRHEPIRARRSGVIARSRKWVRRNPALAVLVPVVATLALVLGAMAWRQLEREPAPTGIAVLPFDNMSDDKENAFLADGLQDDVLTRLAKVADLKVISRTSVLSYRGERNVRKIGSALRVSHVLEGSVHPVDGRIRVNAQLIDARTDAHLWAETYEGERTELFAIESEVAQQVATRLRGALSAPEKKALQAKPTRDMEAYEYYSRGRTLLQTASLQDADPMASWTAAAGLLEKAVARDPQFALGYCALAEADLTIYWTSARRPEWLAKAEAAVARAIELAPDAGETHLIRAQLAYRKLDYDHALEELEMAAPLLPNNAQLFRISSWVERRLGRWREAIRHASKAVELDPRDAVKREDLIMEHLFVRHYAEAARLADQAISDFPERADQFRLQKGSVLLSFGDLAGARAALESCPPSTPMTVTKFLLEWSLFLYERNFAEAQRCVADRLQLADRDFLTPDVCFEGWVAQAQGDSAQMQETLAGCRDQLRRRLREKGEDGIWVSNLALAEAALGDREAALRDAEHAREIVDPLERSIMALDGANVYCSLGDRDRALAELATAVRTSIGVSYGDLKFNPCWDSLRDDPRFEKILEQAAKPLHI